MTVKDIYGLALSCRRVTVTHGCNAELCQSLSFHASGSKNALGRHLDPQETPKSSANLSGCMEMGMELCVQAQACRC